MMAPVSDLDRAVVDLEASTRAFVDAQAAANAARIRLASAIVDATRAGLRQTRVVEITGYTREHVRRLVRASGAESE
jgi:hypothetical protein